MGQQGQLVLRLQAGERRQVLVEAGSGLLVLGGSVRLREPPAWLAETMVARERDLAAEQWIDLAAGGWIEVLALEAAEAVVLARLHAPLWERIARCLGLSRAAAPGTGLDEHHVA